MPIGRICACLVVSLAIAVPAAAQQKEPIGRFAADLRGIFARHKAEPSVATELGVTPLNLPARSFGLAAGAHVYPWRGNKIVLGFGGAFWLGRGSPPGAPLRANGKPQAPPHRRPHGPPPF